MLQLIATRSGELVTICQRYGVRRLELFGSAAREDFDPGASDFDFLVEFISDDWHGAADRWFGLMEDLETLFGANVDLVDLRAARDPYFLESIKPDRVVLYAA